MPTLECDHCYNRIEPGDEHTMVWRVKEILTPAGMQRQTMQIDLWDAADGKLDYMSFCNECWNEVLNYIYESWCEYASEEGIPEEFSEFPPEGERCYKCDCCEREWIIPRIEHGVACRAIADFQNGKFTFRFIPWMVTETRPGEEEQITEAQEYFICGGCLDGIESLVSSSYDCADELRDNNQKGDNPNERVA